MYKVKTAKTEINFSCLKSALIYVNACNIKNFVIIKKGVKND